MVVTDYNEQFLDKRGTDHLIEELKAYIDSIATGDIDLSNYVTKSELQAKLDALDINIDLSSYATKEELTNAINSIDLSAYAKKTDIPSLNGYVTETELNAKGYLTEHQDLSAYALKTEIPSLDGYATTEYVDNAIANVPSGGNVDLSNYYTKAETNALIPSLEGYATKEYVSTAINSIPATDLSNYYTKSETYSKTEVDTLVANSGGGGSSSGSGEVYSKEEEIAIGTWIDGRTIYRKVFEVTIRSDIQNGTPAITSIEHGIENFNQLVDLRCINNNSTMKTSIGAYGLFPVNLYTSLNSLSAIKNYSIRPTVTNTKIMIDAGIQWKGAVITVIVEYTKTV